jgi:hypothetical protein
MELIELIELYLERSDLDWRGLYGGFTPEIVESGAKISYVSGRCSFVKVK